MFFFLCLLLVKTLHIFFLWKGYQISKDITTWLGFNLKKKEKRIAKVIKSEILSSLIMLLQNPAILLKFHTCTGCTLYVYLYTCNYVNYKNIQQWYILIVNVHYTTCTNVFSKNLCLYSDYYSHLTLNMKLVLKIVALIYHLISLTLDFRRMNYYQK